MNIPKQIQKRIAKTMHLKPELQTPFVQGEYEWITNTFFFVKIPKSPEQKETTANLPVMSMAEKINMPKTSETIRLDIQHLEDVLAILKANGATCVDMKVGTHSIYLEGLQNPFTYANKNTKANVEGILMAINK